MQKFSFQFDRFYALGVTLLASYGSRFALAGAAVVVAFVLPGRILAQTGTVTDDAFVASNPAVEALNLNGQGTSLVVAGADATAGPIHVGSSAAYVKRQLPSSLPPSMAAANVAKATLKLYLSPGLAPSGILNLIP